MKCCGKKQNDDETRDGEEDEEEEPCCIPRDEKCSPYKNGCVIAAQLLAMVATLISWVWWVTFVFSVAGLIVIQLLWWYHMSLKAMYWSVGLSSFCCLFTLGVGIYIAHANFRDHKICFDYMPRGKNWNADWDIDTADYDEWDAFCDEEIALSTLAFLSSACWAAAASCLFYFALHGTAEDEDTDDDDDDLERGNDTSSKGSSNKSDTEYDDEAEKPHILTDWERAIPKAISKYFEVEGRRYLCIPYRDSIIIAAVLCTIAAVLLSWVWWITLLLSIFAMAFFQLLWCTRQSKPVMYALGGTAVVCSIFSISVGIYVAAAWRRNSHCYPFRSFNFGGWAGEKLEGPFDFCNQGVWALVAFLCGFLWAFAAAGILYFVRSGKHDEWEEYLSDERNLEEDSMAPEQSLAATFKDDATRVSVRSSATRGDKSRVSTRSSATRGDKSRASVRSSATRGDKSRASTRSSATKGDKSRSSVRSSVTKGDKSRASVRSSATKTDQSRMSTRSSATKGDKSRASTKLSASMR